MEALEHAYITRARHALSLAIGDTDPALTTKAQAFVDYARVMFYAGTAEDAAPLLRGHGNELVAKASAANLDGDTWSTDAGQLAANWVASIAPRSAFDQLARHGRFIEPKTGRAMIATGVVGDIVAEGDPKVIYDLDLAASTIPRFKACGIVVMTQELARAIGPAGRRLFETELTSAVSRAMNTAVSSAVVDTDSIGVPSTGDALTDLRAGLAAAPASDAYVVLVGAGVAADLATRAENRGGMGVRGGDFVEGVSVVVVDGLDTMIVVPASRAAVVDGGLQIRSAGHASIDLRDTPESPAQLTSLWQTNSVGLLIEREIGLLSGSPSVVVGGS